MTYRHILITRFNIPVAFAKGRPGLSQRWLMSRFFLFERFCVPSVKAQVSKDFEWVILIDEKTPELWVETLKRSVVGMKISVMILPIPELSEPFLKEALLGSCGSDKIIITSRFDNDDSISREYISTIADVFSNVTPDRPYLVHFSHGCRFHRSGIFLYNYRIIGPFISLMTPSDKFVSVYCRPHADMSQVGKLIELPRPSPDKARIMWMQVVHSRNISNRLPPVNKRFRIPYEILKAFGVTPS